MLNKEKYGLSSNCMSGYLTQGCAKCIFWNNGRNRLLERAVSKVYNDGSQAGIGCNACFPIGDCPFFKAMEQGIDLWKEP